MNMTAISYETDFVLWTQQQAEGLRNGHFADLDFAHLAEEIESMGVSERHALSSHLFVILMHLLKWVHQPDHQNSSWRGSIRNSRRLARKLIKGSPSLRQTVQGLLEEEYPDAREEASEETGLPLSTFPEFCPFTVEQVMGDFWP